jgi:hypothetical protein
MVKGERLFEVMKAKSTTIAGALAILACAAAVALAGAWIWAGANVAAYLSTGP